MLIYVFIDLDARLSLLIVMFNLIKYMQYFRLELIKLSSFYILKDREKESTTTTPTIRTTKKIVIFCGIFMFMLCKLTFELVYLRKNLIHIYKCI